MQPQRLTFTGHFMEYFIASIGLLILSVLTVGILLPYWIYWSFKYFFTKMELPGGRIVFTGHFMEYFIASIGLMILSIITFGILLPYYVYWSFKYFFTRMEIEYFGNAPTSESSPQTIIQVGKQ